MESTPVSPKTAMVEKKPIWWRLDWCIDQIGWISGITTVIMTIAVMREVIGRYFLNSPSDWSLELSCYLVVGLGYLAAGSTQLHEGHIRVDIVYIRISQRFRNYLDVIIYLICLAWSATLVKQGWELATTSFVRGSHSSEAMMWPLFPSQIMVPIGSFLISLVFIGQIIRSFNNIIGKRGK